MRGLQWYCLLTMYTLGLLRTSFNEWKPAERAHCPGNLYLHGQLQTHLSVRASAAAMVRAAHPPHRHDFSGLDGLQDARRAHVEIDARKAAPAHRGR